MRGVIESSVSTAVTLMLCGGLLGCAPDFPQSEQLDYLAVRSGGELATDLAPMDKRPSERACLLVLLPGIGDHARSFADEGFVAEALRRAPDCDLVLVDARLPHYISDCVPSRVAVDVLAEARRWGYQRVWLVGISLGGYGAVLTAREHPTLVDGVVLIAPMLGMPPGEDDAAREIERAGGLLAWAPHADQNPRHHFTEPRLVWQWLRTSAEGATSPTVLAYGTGDHLASRHELLAAALDSDRVFTAEGRHDWATWRRLWTQVLDARPWQTSVRAAGRGARRGSPRPRRSP